MFLFSPFQFFYVLLYLALVFLCLSSTDFVTFWFLIELSVLAFWSILLSFTSSISYYSMMLYFLVQSCVSLSLLYFYFVGGTESSFVGFIIHLLVYAKLGLFPFNYWYFFSLLFIPRVSLFIALTVQNVPVVYIYLNYFSGYLTNCLGLQLLIVFTLLGTFITVFTLISTCASDVVSLVVVSSIISGCWFLFSVLASPLLGVLYLFVYSCPLILLMFSSDSTSIHLALYTQIGFPPFPLFFVKFIVVFWFMSTWGLTLSWGSFSILLLLVISAIILLLYFPFLFSGYNSRFSISFRL